MEIENGTLVTYFIIKGISDIPELQTSIFLLVLLIYLLIIGGNMTILLLVCLDPQLHTPMYFFLGNLALIDMFSPTITLHKVLTNFLSGDNRVSHVACMAEIYLYDSLVSDEMSLLTAMSYDRYVAICNPLRYQVVMGHRVSITLAIVSWIYGFLVIIPVILAISGLNCYKSNIINHFFCDMIPLMKQTCSDLSGLQIIILIQGSFVAFTTFFPTLHSYIFIISAIIKIRSSTGRRKAFYTCSSHLTVVSLFYVMMFCQYLRPNSLYSLETNKLFSLFTTATVPLLNPLIYSLKNKDVKSALRRQLKTSIIESIHEVRIKI